MEPKGPPPTHEETLGALPGAPKPLADAYAKTGKTPTGAARDKLAANPKSGTRAAAEGGQAAEEEADDPVADMNAPDAVEAVGRMRSREKLQAVVNTDKRQSVKDAAQTKLDSMKE